MDKVTVGRTVHIVAPNGVCNAAIVTEVERDSPDNVVTLTVLSPTDTWAGHRAGYDGLSGLKRPMVGTWHWPERTNQLERL